ncbi:L-proline trans-4-hydroxylase-like isoform X2 [Penaeus japonicus]|uniref:L-proline trans-4-hydroxylase-like isoform X2 n=1 Tax=Penaeus japonicus TaxID=27405 RepID=UPI001C70E76C|nr:L-proline trans-4-hydroxylase-like isoform X2 [Penaeus japonicus]
MSESEFSYDPASWSVTQQMVKAYEKNGYVLVRNMLSKAEIQKLRAAVESSKGIQRHAFGRSDGDRKSRMCVWNHPGDDITGVLARSRRVAGTMQELMGGDEVYHYHSKLMMKDANSGGAFLWHQDYGYWYNNGCLYPDMASVFIPVDDCMQENGCLQVLEGSHKFGRIDHKTIGEQLGADPERVEQAKLSLKHIHVELSHHHLEPYTQLLIPTGKALPQTHPRRGETPPRALYPTPYTRRQSSPSNTST